MKIDYDIEIGLCLFEQYFLEGLLNYQEEITKANIGWIGYGAINEKYRLMLLSINVLKDKIIKREKLK